MTNSTSNGAKRWFSISMLLLGLVIAGFAGVLRGDWIGRSAAQEVEQRVEKRMEEKFEALKEDMQEIKSDLKELLRAQD